MFATALVLGLISSPSLLLDRIEDPTTSPIDREALVEALDAALADDPARSIRLSIQLGVTRSQQTERAQQGLTFFVSLSVRPGAWLAPPEIAAPEPSEPPAHPHRLAQQLERARARAGSAPGSAS